MKEITKRTKKKLKDNYQTLKEKKNCQGRQAARHQQHPGGRELRRKEENKSKPCRAGMDVRDKVDRQPHGGERLQGKSEKAQNVKESTGREEIKERKGKLGLF